MFDFSACPLETKKRKGKYTQCTWTEILPPPFFSSFKIKVSSLHFFSVAQSKNHIAIFNKTAQVQISRKLMNHRYLCKVSISVPFPAESLLKSLLLYAWSNWRKLNAFS
jgi:hypothetical protein